MKQSLAENIRQIQVSRQIEGVRIGKIVNVDESGQVFVDFPGNNRGAVASRFTKSFDMNTLRKAATAGQGVLIVFENNDPELPIIVDTLHSLVDEITGSTAVALDMEEPKNVLIDGERVTFDAKKEIVLRCGKASITLTRAGKVLIKGAYLLNRSSGVNRIRGASVHIN